MSKEAKKEYQYEVDVKELWTQTIKIKSDTPMTVDELRAKANKVIEGDSDEDACSVGDSDYTDTLNQDRWTVKQVNACGVVVDFLS